MATPTDEPVAQPRPDDQPTIAHRSARTRTENLATMTVDTLTTATKTKLSTIDLYKNLAEHKKHCGNFFGTISTDQTVTTARKYFTVLQNSVLRLCTTLPSAQVEAANIGISNIFRELLPHEAEPEYILEYNQLVFDCLLLTTDGEALDLVLMYEREDNGSNLKKRDGRRALFSLLQTYMPVSNNTGNIVKAKLEAFTFDFNKSTIIAQITTFNKLSFQLSTSRNLPISTSEQWSYVTSAINSTRWETFRTVMTLQPQWKSQSNLWLIDQIREHVLGSADNTAEPSKRHSGLGAISSSSEIANMQTQLAAITAALAAITTATETKSRVNPQPKKRPSLPRNPCRYCKELHWDSDCPTINKSKKPTIPPRHGKVGALTSHQTDDHDRPGFLSCLLPSSSDPPRPAPPAVHLTLSERFAALPDPPHSQSPQDHRVDVTQYTTLSERFAALTTLPASPSSHQSLWTRHVVSSSSSNHSSDEDDILVTFTSEDSNSSFDTSSETDCMSEHTSSESISSSDFPMETGYLMGCVPADSAQVSADPFSSTTPVTSWFETYNQVLKLILLAIVTLFISYSWGHMWLNYNHQCKVVRGGLASMTHSPTNSSINSTSNSFIVDSGASDHIANDPSIFTNLDYSVKKDFNVVHGDNVTAYGKGSVTLIANNARGGKSKVVLQDVYYIPNQPMSLISVDKALRTSAFDSPDFKNLTWKLDDSCTLTMHRHNGSYTLDAAVLVKSSK